ncbi:MAG TPA: YdcF family protein [Burkholderiales bacterium]|nr:YdcF family protein [Burkholderiales bacterium]
MEWLTTQAITAWLVPPGSLLLLAVCGALLIAGRRKRLGGALILLSMAALYALSTHFVADGLLASLEPPPLEPHADKSGEVIVVLGGGTYFSAPEYGVDTVGDLTLVRVRYAARLHRALAKPLMVTGGSPAGSLLAEADQMRQALQLDFHVPVKWSENGSNNTLENARLSYRVLKAAGLTRIYLVTHAWHMPRARLAFERAGFTVIPAPTGYTTRFRRTLLDFLPSALALMRSRNYVREVIVIGWYHLRLLAGR